MELHGNSRLPRTASALFLLCSCVLGATGCNNTCVSGVLAPGGSTVNVRAGNPPPSCSLNAANRTVQLEIGAASGTSTPFVITPLRPHVNSFFLAPVFHLRIQRPANIAEN